jgi:hypothetical protein
MKPDMPLSLGHLAPKLCAYGLRMPRWVVSEQDRSIISGLSTKSRSSWLDELARHWAEAIVSRYAGQVDLLARELEQKAEILADDIQRLFVYGS